MPDETLADRLSRLLGAQGRGALSRVAEATKLGKGAVSKIATGDTKAPEPETLRKIADHFGVRVEWLAHGRGTERESGADDTEAPTTPEARARAAAAALGYPDAAIDAGLASAAADNEGDPWEILTRIRMKARIPAPGRLLPPPTVQPYAANEDEPIAASPSARHSDASKAPRAKPRQAAK